MNIGGNIWVSVQANFDMRVAGGTTCESCKVDLTSGGQREDSTPRPRRQLPLITDGSSRIGYPAHRWMPA